MIKRYLFSPMSLLRCSLFIAFVFSFSLSLQAQTAPVKHWDKTFGGTLDDRLCALQQTSDGGYILGGTSESPISGDKSQACQGSIDYWVVKIDASGNKTWEKTFGGSSDDGLTSLQQTSDGGYILGGTSTSGISGDKSQASKGDADYWVVKLDANGNKLWDKTLGSSSYEASFYLQQTSDGGYILGGHSDAGIDGDKSQPNKGTSVGPSADYWLVKLDANGNKLWDKAYGGNDGDYLFSFQQTSDGGYILGGSSFSGIGGDKTQGHQGSSDYWVVKVDANGNKTWDKTFGGNKWDYLCSLKQTSDGGYILGGFSYSGLSIDKTQASKGDRDYWVIKLDASGNKTWDKTIGGSDDDKFCSLQQTTDGGYILGGWTHSGISGDKTQASKGSWDYWVVKLDVSGSKTWDKTFGGDDADMFSCLQQTSDGGYILGGTSWTGINGDKSQAAKGGPAFGADFWVIKIGPPCAAAPSVTPGSNCGAGSVTLSATGAPTGGSYVWYNVATSGTALYSNSSGTFTTPNLSTTTTYYVAAANKDGCEGPRTAVTATIKIVPTVNAGANETICKNGSRFQLTGFSPAGGTWSGVGVNAWGIFIPDSSLIGNHTLTYTVTQNGCTASATKQVTVQPIPKVFLGSDTVVCEGEEITLHAESSSGTYLWSDGSSGSSLKVRRSGKYWVQLPKDGCASSDTIQVTFKTCPKPSIPSPFIPNIITLNHDGSNDTFKPQYLSEGRWHLDVYNRWGVKLYESADYQNNWPDTDITDGTYYYLLKNPETGQQYKGWVEVVH